MQQEQIVANVKAVLDEIARAAKKAGRDPREITLVAATKTRTAQAIATAIEAGVTICGENRVQELLPHLEVQAYTGAKVHFIGHLQTNKVRQVVGKVDMIESVDSKRLAEAIAKQAEKLGITQDILLEVNIGREENKGGVLPEEIPNLVEFVDSLPNIRLRGLMCIPPKTTDEVKNRMFFAQTRQLFVDTRKKMGDNSSDIDCLSMGMSGDFPLAIEEGATLVRVGTALFGPRPNL